MSTCILLNMPGVKGSFQIRISGAERIKTKYQKYKIY